jgi:spore coat protein U-like protein
MLATGLSAGAMAEGGTSNTIPVTATVPQSCIIRTTGSLVFGTYDPVVSNAKVGVNATGQVSVACSNLRQDGQIMGFGVSACAGFLS